MRLTLILLLSGAIILTGWLIYSSAVPEEEVVPEETVSELPSLDFLNSLHAFTEREIPVETVTIYKQSPTLSLSFLYSPFTSRIGFSSSISYKLLNAGLVYTGQDLFLSLGLTLTF